MTDQLETPPPTEADSPANQTIEEITEPEPEQMPEPVPAEVPPSNGKFVRLKRLAHKYWAHKKWTIPLSVLLLVILLIGIPFTRNLLLGTFLHNQTKITVYDTKSNKPVSGADVIIGSATKKTDLNGNVTISPKLGNKTLLISKKYYSSVSQPITITWPTRRAERVNISPTGRMVPISLTNKLTGKPLVNVLIKAAGSETRSDKAGKATIVLPATAATQAASLSVSGYNAAKVTIQVTDQAVAGNKFTLTPTGKLYFLSNQSGKIDVVKTDLDGSNRQTVFAGTGSEDAQTTSLLASRDWKYLALLAKHNANTQSLYLINTANDQVSNIDGGSTTASFNLIGWANDTFVYQVNRSNISNWQSGAQALKSYDATAGKLYNIDQTQGEGTNLADAAYTTYSQVYLLKNELVFAKNWSSNYSHGPLNGKTVSLFSTNSDGSSRKTIKDFPVPDNTYYYQINLAAYEPASLYVQVPNSDGTNKYYEYEAGKLNDKSDLSDDTFNKPYPTYLYSPSGKQTFWSELRDNKNTLFIGDDAGQSPKQIMSLSDYTTYGWYSDSYLLVTKNGSELYVTTPTPGSKVLKVTDYYKPQLTYRGYGGGYGGQ